MKAPAIFWLGSLCATTLLSANFIPAIAVSTSESSGKKEEEICGRSPRHMRIAARYTTPKGIGYNQGYVTLEGFFSPPTLSDAWLPFLDVRGHMFDNGKWAANGGLGLRFLSSSLVWGINGYYDYRNTSRRNYNQVGAGLETLGTVWDFRINGYLTLGKNHTSLYQTKFHSFKDHHMLLRSIRQFAMKGMNAEAGIHVDHFEEAPLYFAAGPYYLTGKDTSTWGGELRASVDLLNRHLRLQANTAYDHYFKWTGQGQISLNVSFGGRSRVKKRGDGSCSEAMTLAQRIVQPVDRSEIIPVGKQHLISPAIDPATGQPYYFIFVNNTSHSLGTFESPYPSLDLAESNSLPGQIIYVYPGNGSSYDTSIGGTVMAGLTLQDSQLLLGAATSHTFTTTLWSITIPPKAPTGTLPILTTAFTNGNVITLGNYNTISGFYVAGPGSGDVITGTNITNFTSDRNTIVGNNSSAGISLFSGMGQVVVSSNTFFDHLNGISIPTSALSTLNVTGSTFNSCSNNGIFLDVPASVGFINVSGDTFLNNSDGIHIAGSVGTLNLSGSTFLKQTNEAIEIDGTIGSLNIANCDITKSNGPCLNLPTGSSVGTMTITDSTFLNSNSSDGIFIGGSITNSLTLSRVSSSYNSSNGINFSGATVPTLNISGSTFKHNNNIGIEIQSGSVIGDITITESSLSNNKNSYGLTEFGGNTINSLTISNSHFNFNGNFGLNLQGALNSFVTISGCNFNGNSNTGINFNISNSFDSLTIIGSTMSENTNNGIEFVGGTTITNSTLSGCTFNHNSNSGIQFDSGSTFTNFTLSGCTFSTHNNCGIQFEGGSTVGNLTLSGCAFSTNNNNGLEFDGSSTISDLTLSGCTFNNNNNYNLFFESGSTITTFNINDNSFNYTDNNNGILAFFTNSNSGTISNNSFIFNNNFGISIQDTCNLVVTGNTFEASYNNSNLGYAASINLSGPGPICLQFTGNTTTPPVSKAPNAAYVWSNTGGGVFNITRDSTRANNYGLIHTSNLSGYCQ